MNNFEFELMAIDEIEHKVPKLDGDLVAFKAWARMV